MQQKTIKSIEEFDSYYNELMRDETVDQAMVTTDIFMPQTECLPFTIESIAKKNDSTIDDACILDTKQQPKYLSIFSM